ncbi:MAG: DNA methyltransferase, partial [Kiritimatiellae bacterium]|nr:DNA methyltransferase [Kiritimatiellia bacterium]
MSAADTNPLDAVSSPDLNAERLAELKRLFPDLFSNEGRLNIDELKKVVDPALVTESERYDFRWYGKTASKREAFTPSRAALVYDPARSVNPDKAGGNIIIEGENLEVLKLLNCAYRERIKCIYIDPPYNTGKDFVYSDRFAEGQKPYWEQTGVTESGVKVDSNSDSDGRFHSNWLSMMHSRLLAARYLLRPDGFMVVSIDDAEVFNLSRLMDDVFGEENFIATLVWDKNRKNDAKFFSVGHEYMLVYGRDKLWLQEHGLILRADKEGIDEVKDVFEKLRKENNDNWKKVREGLLAHYETWEEDDDRKPLARFTNVDEKGPYRDDGNINWPGGGGPTYEILHPKTHKPCKLPTSGWRYPTTVRFWEEYAKGRIVFGDDESTVPSVRMNLFDSKTQAMRSVLFSYAQTATQEFQKIFDGKKVFDNPKHFEDIRKLIEYLSDEDDIVLDFFAGSGSTAHAALLANGTRKFILVQFPEAISDKKSTGKRAIELGLKKVSDITIERVKRVIQKFQKEAEGLLPGDAQRQFADSLGFKVYRLEKSAFPRVEFTPDPEKAEDENVELLQKYIADKEQSFHIQLEKEKVRDEVLLKQGFMLDYTVTAQPEFTKNDVVLIRDAHRESLLCLDIEISPETVDAFQTR